MYDSMKNKNLFNMEETIAKDIFNNCDYPWEVLPKIEAFILELGKTLPEDEYDCIDGNIWIAKSATIAPTASITGPCIIGNSTELKNVILFNNVQVPHYNYVGDSILGFKSHMGAGSITSNVKSDKTIVTINYQGEKLNTGLKKMGAILGNYVEVGCNSVLNPGTVIGSNTNVYPLSSVRGFIPRGCIFKKQTNIVQKDI